MTSQETLAEQRDLNKLVNQQHLLFGRRGINPNMNSLFFGKRAPENPSFVDVRGMCIAMVAKCDRYLQNSVIES